MTIEDQILFEDNHLIIFNKISGQIVQADKTETTPLIELLRNYLKIKHQKSGNVFLGIPHRIDRPTTGIVIFAKTSKALHRMIDMFKDRNIKKTYWAIVKNKPEIEKGRLEHYLKKNERNNKTSVFPHETPNAKKAILNYQIMYSFDNYYLLNVDLETGRHHQIRAQLSFIGSPIKGDLKYNFDRPNQDRSICLHARKIEFNHPVTKELMRFEAPVLTNENIWKAIAEIEFSL